MSSRVGHLPRCGAVWAAATVAAVATVAWLLPGLQGAVRAAGTGRLASHPFEDLLVWLCSAAALVATCWLWAVTTLVTLAAARGRAGAGLLGVPDAVRRVVLAACGVALVGGIGAPALATPGEVHHDHTTTPAALLSGLPLPDRASGGRPAVRAAAGPTVLPAARPGVRPAVRTPAGSVRVQPGDSLWRLAARDLPASAGDARVTARWQEIYALNRAVIGDDPDLIHPDQQLRLPRD